jgi:hypothetical protein
MRADRGLDRVTNFSLLHQVISAGRSLLPCLLVPVRLGMRYSPVRNLSSQGTRLLRRGLVESPALLSRFVNISFSLA